jgi:hypothetical protein
MLALCEHETSQSAPVAIITHIRWRHQYETCHVHPPQSRIARAAGVETNPWNVIMARATRKQGGRNAGHRTWQSMQVCRCSSICHGKTQELDLHEGKGTSECGCNCTGGQVETMQNLALVSNFAQEPVTNNTLYPVSIEWIRIVSACAGVFNHKSVPHSVHCDSNWQVISVQRCLATARWA